MRVLVVGLGSMGKRRIRNLRALGLEEIAGFDVRADRVQEASASYGVQPYRDFESAVTGFVPDALVISTAPRHHMDYAFAGLDLRLPCFIEASVVDADRIHELDSRSRESGVLMAPSCSMRYYPGPQAIKELLAYQTIGTPLTFTYQTGQWLPDWHPWEDISDFYVSERETGGCREIVPFELTWLNEIFGDPVPLACVRKKVSGLPADIDDVYHFILEYPQGVLANITVEVLSQPHACRELRVTGDAGTLVLSAHENAVRYSTTGNPEWTTISLTEGTVEDGYINPEEPYIAEMAAFLAAIRSKDFRLFPNTLAADYAVLRTLHALDSMGSAL